LYAYTLTLDVEDDDEDEGGIRPIITYIALHRIVAVCAGVLWGMFITIYIWPISARYDIRVGLSEMYLHLGWFFRSRTDQKPVDLNGSALERAENDTALDKFRPLLNKQQELALQGLLGDLRGLLNAAESEPRLKVCSCTAGK